MQQCLATLFLITAVCPLLARADIYRWDNGQMIPGTEGITPGPGIDLSRWGTDPHNLRYGNFSGDLSTSAFFDSWLDNARFINTNLTNALLERSTLTNADLTGALVTGACFYDTTSRGFTQAQLVSTASYQQKNLQGIGLGGNDLTGWDFTGQRIRDADFSGSNLTKYQLYSTSSYHDKDLRGIGLGQDDLTGWDFSEQNVQRASFGLTNLTKEQLYLVPAMGLKPSPSGDSFRMLYVALYLRGCKPVEPARIDGTTSRSTDFRTR